MTVRPTLYNKKVKTFLEVKDLCLFMGAAMTVAVCKTRKWLLGPETRPCIQTDAVIRGPMYTACLGFSSVVLLVIIG